MIAFLVNHPWLILTGWVAICALITGLWIGYALWAEKHPPKPVRIARIAGPDSRPDSEWSFPPKWHPTEGQTHLGKTTLGEERRAA